MIQAFTTLRKLLVPGGSGHLLPGAGALRTLLAVPVALCLLSACHGGSGPAPAMSGQESTDSVKTMMEQVDHFTRAGMYDKAFEKLTRAENLARNSGNQEALANVYNRFFILCNNTAQYPRALDYITRAAEIAEKQGDSVENYRLLNNKAITYLAMRDYDSAMLCFDRAKAFAAGNPHALSVIDVNIADMYFSQGEWGKTEEILERVVLSWPDNYHPWLNLALISSARGERRRTLELIRRTSGAPDTLAPSQKPDYYSQLTSIYLNLGDSVAAFGSLVTYLDHQQHIDSLQNAERFNELTVMYQADELASKNRILSLELGRRNIILIALGLMALLLIAVILLLRRRARSEREHNEAIHAKNQQILQMEREMREVLHEQVDKRNRELATYAMEKAALAESRQALAREAARAATDNDADLRNILNQLSRRLGESDSEAVTKDFRIYFERVHPRFADNLKQKHPQITNNDLRLCIFLYLGMSTKEIAALLSREIRSVETARLRLRKKLGLPPGASLQDYLASV